MTSIQTSIAPVAPVARHDLAAALDKKREAAKADERRTEAAEAPADTDKVETSNAAPPPEVDAPPPPPEEPPPPPRPEVRAYQEAQARADAGRPAEAA
jgi:hypothetical protein